MEVKANDPEITQKQLPKETSFSIQQWNDIELA